MCGIIALFGKERENQDFAKNRENFLRLSKRIRHRGPDWNGIYENIDEFILIGHERLSIVSPESGSQPIISNDENRVLSVNGEIYNHTQIYSDILHNKYKCVTKSDCEVILHLYPEYGAKLVKMLDGIFSFVFYDKSVNKVLIARDPIGIIPLYYGKTKYGEYMFASECKCLIDDCEQIELFPPGHYLELDLTFRYPEKLEFTRYYNPNFTCFNQIDDIERNVVLSNIRNSLIQSVDKRLMADVPFGVLLSGGLDSSLIASITSRLLKNRETNVWGNKLHSFSIGLPNAPDLIAARQVAEFLGTIHHEFHFTEQDGIDAIRDLIWHLETYDVTTIRASTPMYLLSRKIKSLGIKMVLSGEGADEVFGGYLYFHHAPNNDEFHKECVSRVSNLHHFDCLRANKSTMAWGVEARVPFLDQSFLNEVMNIHPELKCHNGIEKWCLREAFNTGEEDRYLPDSVLWRQKEQFSDGVGYSWIDSLKEFTETNISDEVLKQMQNKDSTIKSKEAAWYRQIYDELFPESVPIKRWIPRTDWDNVGYDPSGRAQTVHNSAI